MATEVIDHGEEHIYDVFLNDQVVKLPLFYILFFVCVVLVFDQRGILFQKIVNIKS